MIILINMNQKLLFVSIIAIVAAFGMSAIAVGVGSNMAFASGGTNRRNSALVGVGSNMAFASGGTNCRNSALVGVNACDVNACVPIQALNVLAGQKCQQQ